MAVMNSQELFAERQRLADEQRKLVTDGKKDEALVVEGEIRHLDVTLEHVLDEEAKLRREPSPSGARESFGAMVLGPKDEFHGVDVGFRKVLDVDPTVVTVTTPEETDFELPRLSPALLNNFAATLPETPAVGAVNYKKRGTTYGAPATWDGVDSSTKTSDEKASVVYTFDDAVANVELIAGYTPVSKPALADYDDLMDVIENDLLIDLQVATDAKYLTGNNQSGIVGITNTAGIQTYTTASGGNYYEAIRKMRTIVMKNARRVPTHVCVSPEIREAIDLYKTTNGFYQTLGTDTIWGMQVVEDVNCPGILVYDSFAARRRAVRGGVTVEIGYHGEQFVKNELTILAEWSKALQVPYPDAFAYATKTDLDKSSGAGA